MCVCVCVHIYIYILYIYMIKATTTSPTFCIQFPVVLLAYALWQKKNGFKNVNFSMKQLFSLKYISRQKKKNI